jgi:hypothetical protein
LSTRLPSCVLGSCSSSKDEGTERVERQVLKQREGWGDVVLGAGGVRELTGYRRRKSFPPELALWIQTGYIISMKTLVLVLSVVMAMSGLSVALATCNKAYPLFRIERSKNKNIVQYDICVSENGDVPDSKPVTAYWILENGKKHDLNFIEANLAYGIDSQEKLGENRYRIVVVAMKDRNIVVEKSAEGYRAITLISGKESILEKIYVNSEERMLGLPKVDYIDLFGRAVQTDASVKERIIPQ